ncbi:MAG: SulP family inorganic anion transporter [Coriobacteriia bacterium]|nr:SulP family inorganic anion transporter [Coriobacteriia bacterium]
MSARDVGAGLANAVANIPDAMANAVLAGLSPIQGLYALLAGTPAAALTTGSQVMTVAVTAAMALAVGDALLPFAGDDRLVALVTLTVLVGVVCIVLGALKAASLMRFVPNAVMRGFLAGVAVAIVLGQIPALVGVESRHANKVARLVDIVLHPLRIDLTTLALGVATVALILSVGRTPFAKGAMALSLAAATALAAVLGLEITTVGDISSIPRALPAPILPKLSLVLALALPAVAIALIALIQSAGISKSVPNPDGTYPDMDRDFLGQGIGNISAGLLQGMPVGGSVSSTATNVQAGAESRLASFMIGPTIAAVLLLFGDVVELVPMTCLAAILIIVGVRAIDLQSVLAVWQADPQSGVIMGITFAGTLVMPIQYAVGLGVALSVVRYVYRSSLDVRVVELEPLPHGRLQERPAPLRLRSDDVTVLEIYGTVYFAGAQAAEQLLPDPAGARNAVVVIRLRGRTDTGSTFLEVLRRYNSRLVQEDGALLLAGVSPQLSYQLERTRLAEELGRENLFYATRVITDSTTRAIDAARERQRGISS